MMVTTHRWIEYLSARGYHQESREEQDLRKGNGRRQNPLESSQCVHELVQRRKQCICRTKHQGLGSEVFANTLTRRRHIVYLAGL